jgi:hypothetical protein
MTDSPHRPLDADPAALYVARRDRYAAERDDLQTTWNRLANGRLAAGLVAIGCGAWGLWGRSALGGWLALVGFVAFVALALWHNRVGQRRARAALFAELNATGLARIGRDWDALGAGDPPPVVVPPDHPFAHDIDLFGRASLARLLDTAATPMGRAALADWLLHPAAAAVVRERQAAVTELAPRLAYRQEVEAVGRRAADRQADPAPFLAWAEGGSWLGHRRWLLVLAWLGPLLLLAAVAAQATGATALPLWPLAIVLNLLVGLVLGAPAGAIGRRVAEAGRAMDAHAAQLGMLAAEPFVDPLLRRLQGELDAPSTGRGGGSPRNQPLARVAGVAARALPAGSPAGFLMNAVTCWDVHVLAALERWQGEHGRHARRWLDVLGEAEALAALSTLAFDNPDWTAPRYDPAEPAVAAHALGHPLLAAAVRKSNDVTVGPAGTFLLVTGSNMSGKSTLLRAIGLNAALAWAGGPVCVAELRLPPVRLWTSVRVQDSLERGVSFFMAELQRLKLVVDAADRAMVDGGPPVLFLLDEILQGTNTAERQIAARRIINHLVERGAIGAVSTHDLSLADAPELATAAVPVHFRDEVHDGPGGMEMVFDRVLRPGVATTTNALRLMELIGLGLEPESAARAPERGVAGRPAT